MKKKIPLIGISIIAVVLLILGSLTNVIGYQSVKSTAVNDSPLFRTRTQRATNQQQNNITSQYLGEGQKNLLQFPTRDNKMESLKKVIDFISKMDDKTFAWFTELCIQRTRQNNSLRDLSRNDIVDALHLLKTRPETVINPFINRSNYKITSYAYSICHWTPGCIPGTILIFLACLIAYYIVYKTIGQYGPFCWLTFWICTNVNERIEL